MLISLDAFRALLRKVRQRLVNAASTYWGRARPGVHGAWETFEKRFFVAVRQLIDELIDAGATAAKEAFAWMLQGWFPAAL